MNRWTGPVAGLALVVFLLQFGPRPPACAVANAVTDPPPLPATDLSLLEVGATNTAPGLLEAPDPFSLAAVAPVNAPPRPSGAGIPSGPAPSRPWKVTGLVGQRAAVLVRADGRSMVVKLGERLDSATVVGISQEGVELQDRSGRFLLKVP
jgi:hypothetical protein